MARKASKRDKEKRWKQAQQSRLQRAREDAAEQTRLLESAHERGIELVEFTITHEPMPDPLLDALPEADRDEFAAVAERVREEPVAMRERLRALVDRYPHIPTLWNWLTLAEHAAGDADRMEYLVEQTYVRFPDYLNGIAQWVMLLLRDDRVEDAARVLNGRLGLHMWWPDRRVYHATEYVVFNAMLGMYFLATGQRRYAGFQLKCIRDILPEHPAVDALAMEIVRDAIVAMSEEQQLMPRLPEAGAPAARQILGMAGA